MTPAIVGSNPTTAVKRKEDNMRVKDGYWDTMEMLGQGFGDKKLLKAKEVAKFLGIDYRTALKRFSFKDGYISISVLARELC